MLDNYTYESRRNSTTTTTIPTLILMQTYFWNFALTFFKALPWSLLSGVGGGRSLLIGLIQLIYCTKSWLEYYIMWWFDETTMRTYKSSSQFFFLLKIYVYFKKWSRTPTYTTAWRSRIDSYSLVWAAPTANCFCEIWCFCRGYYST